MFCLPFFIESVVVEAPSSKFMMLHCAFELHLLQGKTVTHTSNPLAEGLAVTLFTHNTKLTLGYVKKSFVIQ